MADVRLNMHSLGNLTYRREKMQQLMQLREEHSLCEEQMSILRKREALALTTVKDLEVLPLDIVLDHLMNTRKRMTLYNER